MGGLRCQGYTSLLDLFSDDKPLGALVCQDLQGRANLGTGRAKTRRGEARAAHSYYMASFNTLCAMALFL